MVTKNPALGRPQARTKLARARAIIRLATLGADAPTQTGAGNSAIIVTPLAGSAHHEVDVAVLLELRRDHLRPHPICRRLDTATGVEHVSLVQSRP